jgi:hypothetical protein
MEQVEEQIRDVDTDAPEAEETDAPGPDPKDGDADDASAYREFLADRRTIRYGDTEGNRSKLLDYLLRFDPPLQNRQPRCSSHLARSFSGR